MSGPASGPRTLPHTFTLPALRLHFAKTPNPPASNRLIDLPGDEFLDTEEEITVIAAALWVLCVQYDKLDEDKRPADVDKVRKWIVANREGVVARLMNKVEPPFSAWSVDQVLRDVGAMMEELLTKTLASTQDKAKEVKKD